MTPGKGTRRWSNVEPVEDGVQLGTLVLARYRFQHQDAGARAARAKLDDGSMTRVETRNVKTALTAAAEAVDGN